MNGEDAFKNYYTLAYYIDHNTDLMQFNGMNYPFGEHVVYTDNQPAIAIFLDFLNAFLPIDDHLAFVMLLLFISSMIIGISAMSEIVKAENRSIWLIAIASVGVMLLSPQLQRISGHYSLAYAGIIPITFWLDFQMTRNLRFTHQLFVISWLLICAFIHPYLLVMQCGLLLLASFVRNLRSGSNWLTHLKSSLVYLLPIILFQLVVWLTDSVSDRPSSPYGFLAYKASIESVFLPIGLPYFEPFTQAFSDVLHPSSEGFFYLGASSLIVAFIAFWLMLKSRTRDFLQVDQNTVYIHSLLIASLPLLVLSLGLPFAIKPLDEFLPILGPLRQFRGIGRFTFVVYYAFGLNLILYLSNSLGNSNQSLKTRWISYTLIALLFFEAANYWWFIQDEKISQTIDTTVEPAKLNPQEFQCIYPLPYFHIGSETFRTSGNERILSRALELSLATGLPLNAVQMSRTSLGQTIQQFDLTTVANDYPVVLNEYDPNKLILIAHIPEDQLNKTERRLLQFAKPIGEWQGLQLRSIRLLDFQKLQKENFQLVKRYCESISGSGQPGTRQLKSFEDGNAEGFRGSGKTILRSAQNDLLAEFESKLYASKGNYKLSFWMNASIPQTMNTQLLITESESEQSLTYDLSELTDHIVMVDGDWALVELDVKRNSANSDLQVILYRNGEDLELVMDELMIREESNNKCEHENDVSLNNWYFEPSE